MYARRGRGIQGYGSPSQWKGVIVPRVLMPAARCCGKCAKGLGRLGQDPYFNSATGSDTFDPATLQPVASDITATPTAKGYTVPAGTTLTPAATAALANTPGVLIPTAGSLFGTVNNNWLLIGAVGLVGAVFLLSSKKR